jgi:hypothetical protein
VFYRRVLPTIMLSQHIGKLVYSCRPARLYERRKIQIFMLAFKWLTIYLTLFCSAYTQQHPICAGGRNSCTSTHIFAPVHYLMCTIWCSIYLINRPQFIVFYYGTFYITNEFTLCTTMFHSWILFQYSSLFDIDMTLFQGWPFLVLFP